MSDNDFTTEYRVDRSPSDVLAAIADVRAFWTPPGNLANATIEGDTANAGDEFVYRDDGIRFARIRVDEVAADRVVWRVLGCDLGWVDDRHEWTGSRVIFELSPEEGGTLLRFTHVGLTPAKECYSACSRGWSGVINQSLRDVITTGTSTPAQWARAGLV